MSWDEWLKKWGFDLEGKNLVGKTPKLIEKYQSSEDYSTEVLLILCTDGTKFALIDGGNRLRYQKPHAKYWTDSKIITPEQFAQVEQMIFNEAREREKRDEEQLRKQYETLKEKFEPVV